MNTTTRPRPIVTPRGLREAAFPEIPSSGLTHPLNPRRVRYDPTRSQYPLRPVRDASGRMTWRERGVTFATTTTRRTSSAQLRRGDTFIDHTLEAGLHRDLYAIVDRTFGPYWTDRGEVVDVSYRMRYGHVVVTHTIPTTRVLDIFDGTV